MIVAILIAYLSSKLRLVMMITIGALIGLMWSAPAVNHLKYSAKLVNRSITVCGQAIQDSVDKKSSIKLTNLTINKHRLIGKALIKTDFHSVKRTNYLCAKGRVDVAKYGYIIKLNEAKIIKFDQKVSFFTKIRDFLASRLNRLASQANRFGQALLLGNKFLLTNQEQDRIRISGLSHVIVVSGFHLLIIVKLIDRLNFNSRRLKFAITLTTAFLFVLVSGLSASLIRAWLLLLFGLIAWFYGRKFNRLNLFILVLTLSLLINPLYALFDYNWLLSFSAFLIILVIEPIVKQFFWQDELNIVADLILTIVLVQLSLLPLLSFLFGQISLVAVITNLLVVPVVSLLMLDLILLIIFINLPLISWLIAQLNQLLIDYVFAVIDFMAKLPIAKINLKLDNSIIIIYAVYFGLIFYFNWQNKRDQPYKLIDIKLAKK